MSSPVLDVLSSYRDWLGTNTPAAPERPGKATGDRIPVFYSHPGDSYSGSALVWFEDIAWPTETQALRATVRRRVVRPRFQIVIGINMVGRTDDGGTLQRASDDLAMSVVDLIDLDIATEEHLHCPDLVDMAWLRNTNLERGTTANGCGTRATLTIEFESRHL